MTYVDADKIQKEIDDIKKDVRERSVKAYAELLKTAMRREFPLDKDTLMREFLVEEIDKTTKEFL